MERVPLLRVNRRKVDFAGGLPGLVPPEDEAPLLQRLVDTGIVLDELESRGIELGAAALQAEMDAFRRERGLFSARATRRWLEEHGLTHARLEAHLAWRAARSRLLDEVTESAVGEAYYRDPEAWDTVRVARLSFPNEERAGDAAQEAADAASFLLLAARGFAAGGTGPEFLKLRRGDLAPETAGLLFGTAEGAVAGPLPEAGEWRLFLVLRRCPARLRDPDRALIEETLFREWLAERRKEAVVEWV